ncbi:MAG TPA: sigma factor [Labilithrix sp.]|nr:sigma factor [Labilithrix sp.]
MPESPSTVIGPDLRSALIAMVRKRVPESEVEDIVQATLADALESPHAPKDSESLRRWIFGVAKNKVVDYHRRAGRETFELPEVPGKAAPHVEADLLRWAEKHLPPGEDNKTTLDWMLREGEGEKLESIAETEKVPAPRVRQRVSRLRRHLKAHWQKEVALLVTFGVIITIVALLLRTKKTEPIANEDLPRAEELRKLGVEKCQAAEWKDCIEKLDAAKKLDPAGDARPEVRRARDDAAKALAPDNIAPPPVPTSSSAPTSVPAPEPSGMKGPNERKLQAPAPFTSEAPQPKKMAPPKHSMLSGEDPGDSKAPAPARTSALGEKAPFSGMKPAGRKPSPAPPEKMPPEKKADPATTSPFPSKK